MNIPQVLERAQKDISCYSARLHPCSLLLRLPLSWKSNSTVLNNLLHSPLMKKMTCSNRKPPMELGFPIVWSCALWNKENKLSFMPSWQTSHAFLVLQYSKHFMYFYLANVLFTNYINSFQGINGTGPIFLLTIDEWNQWDPITRGNNPL